MRVLRKNRESRGFSLAELLIVVAIIGILLAVAVPNVLSYYRELKITELDDDARTIFLAAQNQLTALVNSGEKLDGIGETASRLAKAGDPSPKLHYVEYKAADAATTTPTAPSATGLRKILPGGAVDTHFHKYNYVIEFDTESGAVYGVWYWEKDGFKYEDNGTKANQDKTTRLKNGIMVGFYGGDQIDRLQFNQLPYPTVQLINAEELRLVIGVPEITPTSGSITGDFTFTISANGVTLFEDAKLKVGNKGTVVLDTLKVTNAYSTDLTEARNNAKTAGNWVVGMKYKAWRSALGDKLPLPGDDITLTVKMSYSDTIDGKSLTPSTLVVTGNTLFEKVEEDSTGNKTAYIAYGRHLQNLHDSGPTSTTDGIACSGVLDNVSIKKAEQTKDINFAFLNNTGDNNNDVYYWASIYGRTAAGTHDEKYISLHPIYNKNLTFYDGHGFEIRNMDTGRNYYGGMFSYIVGGTYQNILLVNPHIHSDLTKTDLGSTVDKQLTAGALVAMVKGEVKITNCHVYNEYVEDKDKNVKPEGDYAENPWFGATGFNLNGLQIKDKNGNANQYVDTDGNGTVDEIVPIEGLYVERLQEMPHIGAPGAGSMSGGLIGEIQSGSTVTITDSSAAVINIGAKAVGGLVGKSAGNLTIDKSYSASFVFGNRNVAGLVGFVEDTTTNTTTITNSYAAGEIVSGYDKGFKGAGLLHYDGEASATDKPDKITVENCYAAVRYNGDDVDGLPRIDDQEIKGKFQVVGYIYGTFKCDDNNLYVKQNGISYGYDVQGNAPQSGAGGSYIIDKGTASPCGKEITTAALTAKVKETFGTTGVWNTGSSVTNAASDTHPYTLLTETKALKDKAYPYPMLNSMPHYGDWLEEDPTAASLCYYEKYDDGTFGVWGYVTDKTTDNQIPLNSLKPGDPGKGPYAKEDGYCVAVEDGADLIPPESITVDGTSYTVDTTTVYGTTTVTVTGSTKTYDLYQIKGLDAITVGTDYYYHATVGGQNYWFNPFFACEVLKDEPTDKNTPQAKAGAAGFDSTSTDDYAGQVVIRTARQLANLAAQTGSTLKAGNSAQLRAYTQLLDIDYKQYETSIKGKSDGTDAQSPAALTKDNDTTGSYNGNNFVIKNLFIQGDSKTGLFGELSLSGTQGVRNVFLVDVTVNGTGNNVGALVGSAAGSTVIDNCGVYASSAENYKTHAVTGNTTVGGLIGMIGSSTTVQNSFAAVQVTGETAVGGFVGQINGNNTGRYLKNCYAGGFTESGTYKEDSANVTATDTTNGIAGGFVGKLMNYSNSGGTPQYNGLNFQGTIYSTCSVKGATVGLFAGSTSDYFDTAGRTPDPGEQKLTDSLTATDLTLYATGEAFNATARPETYLKTGSDVPKAAVGTGVTAHPYDDTLGTEYPYQSGLTEHHGDWVVFAEPVPEMMLAYIEEYDSGDPGVYMVNYNGTVADDVQHNIQFGAVVKNDYYRILSTIDLRTGSSVTDITLDTDTAATLKDEGTVKIGSTEYHAYTLTSTVDWESETNYYHTVKLTLTATGETKTYLYNPSFACEAFDVTDAAGTVTTTDILPKPNAGGTITYTNTDVLIRSARQLANVQAYTNHTTYGATAQEWTYDQLLNVDFDGYTGTLAGGKSDSDRLGPAKLSTGTYNGHDKTISNLYLGADTIGSDAYAGLFGTVNGTVNHVLLVDVDVKGDSSVTALAVGGLVGKLEGGSVENCGIYVSNKDNYGKFAVSGSGGNGVGGLIGQMTGGAVTNSFAAVMVQGTDPTNGGTGGTTLTNPAGGFVGQVNEGTFENCYVGGFVGADGTYETAPVNVMGNNRVGGFVGSIANSAGGVTFTGTNYSTASVGGPDPANLGLFSGGENAPTGDKPYAVAKAFKVDTTGGTTTYAVVAPRDETTYLTNPVEQTDQKSAETYNMGTGATYPYQPAGDLTHHGDWIGLTKGVYYDTVVLNGNTSSPTTGYYANGESGAGIGANLLVAHTAGGLDYATNDGYMFLSETDLGDEVALGINGVNFTMTKEELTAPIGGYGFAYKVPADALNTMPTDGYYFTVNVNGQFFTANFAFAGEIFDGKDVDHSKPAAKTDLTTADVMIRTPRQLANLGIWTSRSEASGEIVRGLQYEQLLDIYYDEYKGKLPDIYGENKNGSNSIKYNHVPITLTGADAGYNGNGYAIRGLMPGYLLDVDDSNTFALNGLFGRVKDATISKVNLVNPRVVGYADNKAVAQLDKTVTGHISLPGSPIAPIAGETTYVLEAQNGVTTKVEKSDVESEKAGTENYFTIWWNKSGSIDGSDKTFSDDYTSSFRYNFNKGAGKDNNAIEFTITETPAVVKVWWVQAAELSKTRPLVILDKDGTEKFAIEDCTTHNAPYLSTFTISDAGKYYLGGRGGKNYIFKVEVTEAYSGGTIPTPPDPPVTHDDYVNGTLLAKGILAPIAGQGFEIGTSAKVRVGALAGILDGAKVTDSGAYIEYEEYDHENHKYYTYNDKENGKKLENDTGKEAYDWFIVKNDIAGSEDAVGGFAGNITGNSEITRCFSAVKVIGVQVAGGFAGQICGTIVENCYVGGHTLDGSYIYGDDANPKVVKNVETTKEYSGNDGNATTSDFTYTGGFAGIIEGTATFSGVNYTTASVAMNNLAYKEEVVDNTSHEGKDDGDYHTVTITGHSKIGAFAGDAPAGFAVDPGTTTLYATGIMYNDAEDSDVGKLIYSDARVTYKDFSYVKDRKDSSGKETDDWKRDTNTFFLYANQEDYLDQTVTLTSGAGCAAGKYDESLTDVKYPYKSFEGQTIHHGDWTVRYDLVYYEVYEDSYSGPAAGVAGPVQVEINGTKKWVGFYAVLRDSKDPTGRVLNTLRQEGLVVDSGYMIFTDSGDSHITFGISATYGGKRANGKQQFFKSDDRIELPSIDGLAKFAYIIKFETLNLAPSDTYYQHVTINGLPYMLNQHFACEAVNVGLVGADGKLDYDTIRAKPDLEYKILNPDGTMASTKILKDERYVVIRNPWNLASIARYTRDGNESLHREDARTWTYVQTMDIDYERYAAGRIYDGNTNNRSEPGRTMYLAGTNFVYGQAPSMLENGGKFDGNGHTISNLYVSSDSTKKDYVGLFGRITGADTAGNKTTVQNVHMVNYHVNAWGGPDTGIYVGGIVGEIADGAILQHVTVSNLEMDFHKVFSWNTTDKEYRKGNTTIKFNAVGGFVGRLINGTVSDAYSEGLSIDFIGTNYSYNNKEIIKDKDYSLELVKGNGGTYNNLGSPVKEDNPINIGGAIGEIDASASGATVSVTDVYVVNPRIQANNAIASGKDGNIVGGVIGKADGGEYVQGSFEPTTSRNITIENAGTYVDGSKAVPATDNHTAYNTFTVEANGAGTDDLTGGFAGRTDPFVKLIKCFAAVKVEGGEYVGGFVGDLQGSYIEDCYSGGHTEDGEYKTANVIGSGNVGGFAGRMERKESALELKGVLYSTCSVSSTDAANIGLFQGKGANRDAVADVVNNAASGSVTIYATGEAFDKDGTDITATLTPETYLTSPAHAGAGVKAYPYDPTLFKASGEAKNYPYQTGKDADGNFLPHHGDWIDVNSAGAFYYELEGGAYHFYTVDSAGKIANGLTDETNGARSGQEITQWGYGYYYADGTTDPAIAGATEAAADLVNALGKTGCTVMVVDNGTSTTNADQTWTIDGKTFTVNTAYAAAIAVDTGTSAPYQIRTKGQLANIGDSNSESFVQTHDIVFSSDNTPINTFQGNYNGGFYRILNITAPVFDTLEGSATIQNVIVYAPQGYGSKTITGKGGIANTSTGDVTIENTIVAGFTIGQGDNAGGLVGSVGGGTLTITNCEATNTLKGANAGGLVGLVGSVGRLEITNSYAGGSITGSATSAGGLVGINNSGAITYTTVYSYVDMTALTGTPTIYGIGPGATSGSGSYWKDRLPSGKMAADGAEGKTLDELKAAFTGGAGEYMVPGGTNGLTPQTEPFPFEAVVGEGTGKTYHYGAVPTINTTKAAGLFYWEKEEINGVAEYHFYAYGVDLESGTSAKKLADTLCYSHHLSSEKAEIKGSGYGYFYPNGYTKPTISGSTNSMTETEASDEIKSALADAIKMDMDGMTAEVFEITGGKVEAEGWTFDFNGKSQNLYVATGFGATIGDSRFGDEAHPLSVRTLDQLQNVTNSSLTTASKYFRQTHDIDAKEKNYIPGTLQNTGEYNGQSYRILELSVKTSGNVGIFSDVKAKNTIKNIILYSPSGKAVIESTDGNAGGIVGKNSNNCTIENCIVAGYTIKGRTNVGGIFGEINNTNVKIINCQAIVTLDGSNSATGIGGIAGFARAKSSGGGKIENCYAGGTVINAKSDTKVGGIFGTQQDLDDSSVTNCYSYMNLTDSSNNGTKYAIGEADSTSSDIDASSCYFLNDAEHFPTGATQQGTGKSYSELSTLTTTTFGTATNSYVPENQSAGNTPSTNGLVKQTTNFPFPAVVREVNADGSYGAYVHYGSWPAAPTSGDPGAPEPPGVISAPLEALIPPALKLPDETQEADPEDDSHTEVVRRRVQTALVRRAKKQTQEV